MEYIKIYTPEEISQTKTLSEKNRKIRISLSNLTNGWLKDKGQSPEVLRKRWKSYILNILKKVHYDQISLDEYLDDIVERVKNGKSRKRKYHNKEELKGGIDSTNRFRSFIGKQLFTKSMMERYIALYYAKKNPSTDSGQLESVVDLENKEDIIDLENEEDIIDLGNGEELMGPKDEDLEEIIVAD